MSELQDFVEHIQAWHENRTKQLQIILDAPSSTEVRLGTGDDAITLTGDALAGFRAGIASAMSLIGKLPFSVDTSDPDEPEEEDDLAGRNLDAVAGLQVIDTTTGLPKA